MNSTLPEETIRESGSTLSNPVLELDQVQLGINSRKTLHLRDFSGSIHRGEFVRVKVESHHDLRDFVSMLLGLREPELGAIRFEGKNWLGDDYLRHFEMRSRIGRVFSGAAWVQNLTVGENMRLAQRHHRHPASAVRMGIEKWIAILSGERTTAVQASLKRRPAFVEPAILQICQCVRALYFGPQLLLLERPLRFLPEELHSTLLEAIDGLRQQGTAAVWFSDDREGGELRFPSPCTTWRIVHDELKNMEGSPTS